MAVKQSDEYKIWDLKQSFPGKNTTFWLTIYRDDSMIYTDWFAFSPDGSGRLWKRFYRKTVRRPEMKIYEKIKKAFLVGVTLCICFVLSGTSVWAETGTGTIKGININVRSGAGTTADKVATVTNGDVVIVTGSASDTSGNKWYKVKFAKNGTEYEGYIIESYVNYKASENTSPATGENTGETAKNDTSGAENNSAASNTSKWKGQITAVNVNVRKKAVSGAVVGTVSKDKKVNVQKSKKGSDGKDWLYVAYTQSGKKIKGWICSDFVKKIESESTQNTSPDTVETTNTTGENSNQPGTASQMGTSAKNRKGIMKGNYVRIRKKPVNGAVICQLMTGAELTIKSEKTGSDNMVWYKVKFKYNGKNKTGYVRSDFVTVQDTSAAEQGQTTDSGNGDSQQTAGNNKKKGVMKGDYVRVRKKPVNGAVICQLMTGTELTIKSEKTGSDNMVWYKVKFKYNGKNKTGYVRSDFVSVEETPIETSGENQKTDTVTIDSDVDFEAYMTEQGFPDSYKEQLRALHAAHPNWLFKAVQTGLKWEDVIAQEGRVGKNFVSKNAITSWKSMETTAYNWKKNFWYTFDGGAWVAASRDIVRYYMDPRNFLTESAIFQFESLEYEDYQTAEGVRRLLKGSFMQGNYTEPDGTEQSYADSFVSIGKEVGVSPYHLAARCYQEQGRGTSGSISGTVSGYENIFNYYNIGAYAANGNTPVVQGLIYASKTTNVEASNYDRPWNTRYKSILGGSKYVAQKYVKVGQNTLYFQKFNVVNTQNGLYRHQYMTNLQAAESEAVKMSAAYEGEEKDQLVFYIPVYQEMPETASVKPVDNRNPNNYLATLEVAGQNLTPVFDPEVTAYDVTVKKKVKKVELKATAVATSSAVEGTGTVKLKRGQNSFTITCTSESGAQKVYTINIYRK